MSRTTMSFIQDSDIFTKFFFRHSLGQNRMSWPRWDSSAFSMPNDEATEKEEFILPTNGLISDIWMSKKRKSSYLTMNG